MVPKCIEEEAKITMELLKKGCRFSHDQYLLSRAICCCALNFLMLKGDHSDEVAAAFLVGVYLTKL